MKCLVNKDSLKHAIYTPPPSPTHLRDMKAASCAWEPNDLISQPCLSRSKYCAATFDLPDAPVGVTFFQTRWATEGLLELIMLYFVLEEVAQNQYLDRTEMKAIRFWLFNISESSEGIRRIRIVSLNVYFPSLWISMWLSRLCWAF